LPFDDAKKNASEDRKPLLFEAEENDKTLELVSNSMQDTILNEEVQVFKH